MRVSCQPKHRRLTASLALAWLVTSGCADYGSASSVSSLPSIGATSPPSASGILIGPPDAEIIQMYRGVGAEDARAYDLTSRERRLVEAALASLPSLHRSVLERHLTKLSFIHAPGSAGAGLTRRGESENGRQTFDITLRADILEMSLSEFLTTKEARLFEDDGSGLSVQIDAGSARALDYILLHEATHVVDGALNVVAPADSPFRRDIWAGDRTLAAPYDAMPIANTPFRGGSRIPLSKAPDLYASLATSPFVSLYGTASAGEDLAELVSWRRLALDPDQQLHVLVRDASGDVAFQTNLLSNATARRRFLTVDELLESPPSHEKG